MTALWTDLQRYVSQGGLVMIPLTLGALVLWAALGYRALLLRRGRRQRLTRLVTSHQAGQWKTPRGVIDLAVVRGVALLESRPATLRRWLDDDLFDIERELGRFAVLVQAIVVAAPLAGLFGTVTGMIETFDALGDRALFSQSGGIAGGISQALITTQMGLAVAIPGLVVGRLLGRRQKRLQTELERLKDLLCVMSARKAQAAEVAP